MKRWWAENGKSTIIGVVLAIGGYLGWEGWQDKQRSDAEAASVMYQNLSEAMAVQPGQAMDEEKVTTANHLADELKTSYASSLYASQAALFKAKMAVENGKLEEAAAELEWVVDRNVDPALTLLTRSRLARVQMDLELYDDALKTVADQDSGSFKAMFAEIRGDILLAQGDASKARAAYQMALDALLEDQADRRPLLEMKLNDLRLPAASGSSQESTADAGDNS
nr:tetratricopeptide repeat protein [Aestuariicella hydrocarbonica]